MSKLFCVTTCDICFRSVGDECLNVRTRTLLALLNQ